MTPFATLSEGSDRVAGHHPWPRFVVDEAGWRLAAEGLRQGQFAFLGLWGETDRVHLALADPALAEVCVVTIEAVDGHFPSVAARYRPATRLERTIGDLSGLVADHAPDDRPWLDHGAWLRQPYEGDGREPRASGSYRFLPVEGEGLHQIPVGPVHAGIIEPGHFRFTCAGETVVRLEQRLGYVHKGIERLMEGADLGRAARLAGRVSGDSTVAYGIAFARAVEAAAGIEPPDRAHWLRALMAELERIANHLGDIGAICNDAAFALMLAHMAVLREEVLRTNDACFGHRLMMDRVVPGGVARDLDSNGAARIARLLTILRQRLPELVEMYDNTASLQDRTVGTGVLKPELARRFACGGFIGRASGRAVDVRRSPGYPPYDQLSLIVPVRDDGDVNARVWIRIEEVEQSLRLIDQLLRDLPRGPTCTEVPAVAGEGMALVEGFRGDVLVWLRRAVSGAIERCHLRDPSWQQWPLLEAAIDGNIVADFPLCNKSFNCSYAGHDL